MEKNYDMDNVLLKLIYYCNTKKEVYFKRSDVTEYLANSGIFSIPNKQGFDGNLSYFGYDLENDDDGKRILLLRGQRLNEKCISGEMQIRKTNDSILVADDDAKVFDEIDRLIANKTVEAKAFNIRKLIIQKYGLIEQPERLFGNKKLYSKGDRYYTFPDIVIDCINDKLLYEVVNAKKLDHYDVDIIFPLYNKAGQYYDNKLINYKELGMSEEEYFFFEYRDDEMFSEYDIQEITNERILQLMNKLEYDLNGKETTRKILNTVRLNTGALRALALNRDRYKCALCTISHQKLLVCSHIKPWKTGEGRLDVNNVLTLCTLHDALFDKGFISLDQDGNVLYSSDKIFDDKSLKAFIEQGYSKLGTELNGAMKEYIRYHKESIFRE